jgi:hypothetical protein
VAEERWQLISSHAGNTPSGPVVTLDVDVLASVVLIAKTDADDLSLAEVEVLGY